MNKKVSGGRKMDDELLTVGDLCRWLKISRSTVDRWRKDGLPYIKTERLIRFNRKEVEKWLKEHTKY